MTKRTSRLTIFPTLPKSATMFVFCVASIYFVIYIFPQYVSLFHNRLIVDFDVKYNSLSFSFIIFIAIIPIIAWLTIKLPILTTLILATFLLESYIIFFSALSRYNVIQFIKINDTTEFVYEFQPFRFIFLALLLFIIGHFFHSEFRVKQTVTFSAMSMTTLMIFLVQVLETKLFFSKTTQASTAPVLTVNSKISFSDAALVSRIVRGDVWPTESAGTWVGKTSSILIRFDQKIPRSIVLKIKIVPIASQRILASLPQSISLHDSTQSNYLIMRVTSKDQDNNNAIRLVLHNSVTQTPSNSDLRHRSIFLQTLEIIDEQNLH